MGPGSCRPGAPLTGVHVQRKGGWADGQKARVRKQPQGYLRFIKAPQFPPVSRLKVPTCNPYSTALKAKRRAPSALCSLPGLRVSGPACSWAWLKPNPFLPFGEPGWTQWSLAASFSLEPGCLIHPSPLSHLPEFLDLTSVFSLACYLLDTACTWPCLGKGCGVKPNYTEISISRLSYSRPAHSPQRSSKPPEKNN